jgi:hypothetical protein
MAEEPGSGGVAHRTPVDLRSGGTLLASASVLALGLLLVAVWLIAEPRTPDLAAQVYRAGLFKQYGFLVWDEHWYGGHHLPGYSLLFPPLGALLGVRLTGALAVLASTALFERLTSSVWGERARWGAALFAVAALGDVWSGRVTFALGVPLALGAVLLLRGGHPLWASMLATACAAASPVAGALLGLVALTWTLGRGARLPLFVLALPPLVVVGALELLFPEGGFEPYPILSFAATAGVIALFLAAVPRRERMLQAGALVYLWACLLCLLIHSAVGSNIERYGVLLAGPLLACSVLSRRGEGSRAVGEERADAKGAPARARVVVSRAVVLAALCGSAVWTVWGPVRETEAVAGSPATSAAYYLPVEHFLDSLHGGPVRIEVPLTRTHWEAALLAPSVSLARGWEKQLDSKYNQVLLTPGLDGARYEGWLQQQGVAFVALPDVELDPSSAQEGRLIRRGLPFLREVFSSAHWRIYEVLTRRPLLTGPGRLTALGHDSFSLQASRAGSFVVKVHYTRYWTLTEGSGCVSQALGGWTAVRLSRPGGAVVSARFSLGRAFGSGPSCR